MINADSFKKLQPTPGMAATIALFDAIYTKHPERIKKLLEDHDQKFTGDANIDFLQLNNLTRERGRYFSDDFADQAVQVSYMDPGNFADFLGFDESQIPSLVTNATNAAASGGSNIGADIGMVKGLFSTLFGKKNVPVKTNDVFQWPPESEFPKTAWNALIANPNATQKDLQAALKYAKDLATDYNRQIGVHTNSGNMAAANNVTIWRNKAQEFVDAFTNNLSAGIAAPASATSAVFAPGQDPNLNNRPTAQQLLDKMANDADKTPVPGDTILGMNKKLFIGLSIGLGLIIIAIISWLAWKKAQKKKKELAAK